MGPAHLLILVPYLVIVAVGGEYLQRRWGSSLADVSDEDQSAQVDGRSRFSAGTVFLATAFAVVAMIWGSTFGFFAKSGSLTLVSGAIAVAVAALPLLPLPSKTRYVAQYGFHWALPAMGLIAATIVFDAFIMLSYGGCLMNVGGLLQILVPIGVMWELAAFVIPDALHKATSADLGQAGATVLVWLLPALLGYCVGWYRLRRVDRKGDTS